MYQNRANDCPKGRHEMVTTDYGVPLSGSGNWEYGIGDENKCPKCKKQTELYIVIDSEGTEYTTKERCKPCGWEIKL